MAALFEAKQFPASGLTYEKIIGKYLMSIKVGSFYEFSGNALSNQEHFHLSYELVMILSGKGTFKYQDIDYALKKGDLFLSEPYTSHEIHILPIESMKVFYIFFRISQKNNLPNQNIEEDILETFLLSHHHIIKNQPQLFTYLHMIESYGNWAKFQKDYWVTKLINDLIINSLECSLTRQLHPASPNTEYLFTPFEKALDYVDHNITSDICAQEIADAVGVSRRTLYNMFKIHLKKTVHDYINERKIDLAEQYLLMDMSITYAASMVGINSPSYFTQLFKKYKHMTPRTFKKQNSSDKGAYSRRNLLH